MLALMSSILLLLLFMDHLVPGADILAEPRLHIVELSNVRHDREADLGFLREQGRELGQSHDLVFGPRVRERPKDVTLVADEILVQILKLIPFDVASRILKNSRSISKRLSCLLKKAL